MCRAAEAAYQRAYRPGYLRRTAWRKRSPLVDPSAVPSDERLAVLREMLDGRREDELCPDDGGVWTRLGLACSELLEKRKRG